MDFILLQLSSRNDLKFQVKLVSLVRLSIQDNKHLSSVVFQRLMGQIFSLNEISPSITFARQILCYAKLCSLFSWADLNAESQKIFVQAHATLCAFFAKSGSKSLYHRNYKFFKRILETCNLDEYLSFVKTLTSHLNVSILWDNVIRFAIEADISGFFNLHKAVIIDVFNKNVVLSKAKIPDIVDSFCFAHTMSQLSLDDFRTLLFPSIQKAILRSAETSLILISYLFDFLNFDLSDLSQGLFDVF